MKNRIQYVLTLLVCSQLIFGQESSSVIRLESGTKVTNALIYENAGYEPISEGVLGNHSASEFAMLGTNNVLITEDPFTYLFRINATSQAFNKGTTEGQRPTDNLDLDGNPRLSCCLMDIGAFEFMDSPTAITVQPRNIRTVAGAQPVRLTVAAEGFDLRYQWQRNGFDLFEQTSDVLQLGGQWADTGTYQVVVFGRCCDDVSRQIRVVYDPWEFESGGECSDEESWATIWVGGPNYAFLWNTGSRGNTITDFETGQFSVRITDSEARTLTVSSKFYSFSPIEIERNRFHPNNETCDNGSLEITHAESEFTYEYEWFHNGDFFSTDKNLNNVPFGIYRLLINRETHRVCPSDTFDITLLCRFRHTMESTIITPNDDGLNDILNIKHIEFYPVNTVTVVNAFGDVVFRAENYDNINVFWDGRRNGRRVPDGTYYYIVRANNLEAMAGWVLVKTAENTQP